MNISYETMYKSLFIQAEGVVKKELTRHLRSKRVMRQRKQGNVERSNRSQIIDAVSISERPAEIEDLRFLVIGKGILFLDQRILIL